MMILDGEPILVRHPEGTVRGFLALRTTDGRVLAAGDLIQTVHADRVISRVVFRFRDGSVDEQTTIFSQSGAFRLLSDHHLQKGPMFPQPSDVLIDVAKGQVTFRYKAKNKEKVEQERMDL